MRLIAIVLCTATAGHALADGGAADRAAAEAQTRAANNDFVGAATKYREAFSAEPRPDLMCNVGVAYYKAKDLPRAHRYLEQCLSIGTSLDRAFIDNVKKVVAAVESTLSSGNYTPVDLFVQPPTATFTVEGNVVFDEPIVGSRRVWFPFGRYRLTVAAEGFVARVLDIDAMDRTRIGTSVALSRAPVVDTPRPAPEARETSPDASTGGETGSSRANTDAPAPMIERRSVVLPLVASSASVGLAGVALGFYLGALSSADDAGKATEETAYNEARDQAIDRQHVSWAFGAAAGAGAIVSAILWYRYTRGPRVEVRATGDGGASVLLGARW